MTTAFAATTAIRRFIPWANAHLSIGTLRATIRSFSTAWDAAFDEYMRATPLGLVMQAVQRADLKVTQRSSN